MARDVTHILVPTDFSPASDAALTYGKALAKTFGASLHILHVIDKRFTTGPFDKVYGALPQEMDEVWHTDAAAQIAERLSAEEATRYCATSAVVFGPTAPSITRYAAEHNIDLIVMGSHGRTGIAHAVIGSVAERVVRTASCPVLVVRDSGAVKVHGLVAARASTPVPGLA